MKDGICPKCSSREIHVVSNTASEVAIGISFLNTAFLDYHVCVNCGFVEMYVREAAMLPKIAAKFPKVN